MSRRRRAQLPSLTARSRCEAAPTTASSTSRPCGSLCTSSSRSCVSHFPAAPTRSAHWPWSSTDVVRGAVHLPLYRPPQRRRIAHRRSRPTREHLPWPPRSMGWTWPTEAKTRTRAARSSERTSSTSTTACSTAIWRSRCNGGRGGANRGASSSRRPTSAGTASLPNRASGVASRKRLICGDAGCRCRASASLAGCRRGEGVHDDASEALYIR
ncbi:hypothetical protein VTK73DRAFT_9939 [Phialemonium thermophilum]|uniref:Uncharacterized protein n=1 Tax=Phialemonium thermophilum TaxID=223376 RepID=A0ABR3VZ95_9PEZI